MLKKDLMQRLQIQKIMKQMTETNLIKDKVKEVDKLNEQIGELKEKVSMVELNQRKRKNYR